ncbi:MAG: hypothetical protein ACOCXH_10135 [Cyclobacteriaceae bacterium]
MNPHKKGWLTVYYKSFQKNLEKRHDLLQELQNLLHSPVDEQVFYQKTQPTGLIYGHPLSFPFFEKKKQHNWDEKAKMKVLLLEGFVLSSIFYQKGSLDVGTFADNWTDYVHQAIARLKDFYQEYCPILMFASPKYLFKKPDIASSEYIFNQRVNIKRPNNYWSSFFHNSLLYLDVLYFGKWNNLSQYGGSENSLQAEKRNVRFYIIKVMAAAANANKIIDKQEKQMFEYFLHSAHLEPEKEAEARDYLNDGLHIDNIEPLQTEFWILKKFILELALLTLWSDKEIDDMEQEFILKLSQKLDFDEAELNSSMVAIESFVLNNWENVHFLQNKHSFHLVKNRFIKHVGSLIEINKDRIIQEARESRELMYLLSQSRKRELTLVEKQKIKIQLMDILKTIPTFVIIALPFTFVTLPLMIKLLPKSAFPTAWHD